MVSCCDIYYLFCFLLKTRTAPLPEPDSFPDNQKQGHLPRHLHNKIPQTWGERRELFLAHLKLYFHLCPCLRSHQCPDDFLAQNSCAWCRCYFVAVAALFFAAANHYYHHHQHHHDHHHRHHHEHQHRHRRLLAGLSLQRCQMRHDPNDDEQRFYKSE